MQTSEETAVSRGTRCLIVPRDQTETMFDFHADGRATVTLDRYAIIPIEIYESFVGKQLPGQGGESCGHCGAHCEFNEPDPCLGRLPGVSNACCGHGDGGYIQFDNGVVLRGKFYVEPKLTNSSVGDANDSA